MLGRLLQTRALARGAVAGLALGLVTLAALAAWGGTTNAHATAELRSMNQVSRVWSQVFQHIDAENQAAHDFVNAGGRTGNDDFAASIGSAGPSLEWLAREAGPVEAAKVAPIRTAYDRQVEAERAILAAGTAGDPEKVQALHEDGEEATADLHEQVTENFVRTRTEASQYLDASDRRSRQLGLWGIVVFGVEGVLLAICMAVVLGYQRRVERQAASSRHQALHDSLTGLANRTLLADRAAQAVRVAQRDGGQVGLILIDLDRFKDVNDTLGHHYGDLLLRQVADRLQGALREVDTVARLGGDEFAILLPSCGSAYEAERVARRLLAVLQQPADLDGLTVDVSASLGLSVYPADSADAEQLLQHADIAMYAAKRGHLGTAVYDTALDSHSPRQLALLGELRRAVEGGDELVLHYQPKAFTESGRVCGVEALVRWQHPLHGLLPPGEFIPLAEQSGLIEALTRRVLAGALTQCRQWRDDGFEVPVAVNIASRSLLDPEFPALVATLLDRYELPAHLLTLELTESAIIADPDRALQVLGALRAIGVRLSIDDFGTGYSSMAYLRLLPVDELKIDRLFVTDMRTESSNRAIVRAVLELARHLELQVVAEGVEDAETWTELGILGCDRSQGYFLSRPLGAAEITAWLAQHHAGRHDSDVAAAVR